jgi:hypothetical protein
LDSAFRKFINRLNPKGQGLPSEKIFVGAFGKHPGWDDHIDDIGLETLALVTVKRLLYVQGISGNVDSGSWDKLERDQLIREIKHVFVWYLHGMDGSVIAGRMWPSQDGKGRKSYPFVASVQCRKLPIQWVFRNVLPRLEKIEETCAATTSADDVRTAVQNSRHELRQLAQECQTPPDSIIVYPDAFTTLAGRPEMGPNHEGLLRILYHIDREVERHRPDSVKGGVLRPVLLRVPSSPATMLEDTLLWSSYLLTRFGSKTPLLTLMPLQDNWINIILGEPTESQLYCLRAPLETIPITSSIPYNMDSEFLDQARKLIKDLPCSGMDENSHNTA